MSVVAAMHVDMHMHITCHNYFAQIEHLEEKQERGEQLDPEQVHLAPLRSVIQFMGL